jgi:dihydrofolate reductase
MRKLAVNAFVSLDGVMQALGAPEEDPTGGFTEGGWSVNYWDDEMMGWMAEADPYELLLGRGTYEIFAAHWPYVTDGPIAERLNGTRKHVVSTTLEQLEWNNSTLITGNVAEYVTTLKSQDGPDIQVQGSPGLSRRCSSTTSQTSSASGSFPWCSAPASASSETARAQPR